MKKLSFGIAAFFSAAIAVPFAYSRLNNDGLHVKTVTVKYGAVSTLVSATGNVINRDEFTINSPIAAQLTSVRVKEGDSVRQGQILATLDGREFVIQTDKANAALKLAEQNEVDAKRDWERLEEIFLVGGEARKTVDDAKLRWQTKQKELQVAQQELRQARLQHDRLRITSPVDSTIIARHARVGTWIDAGTPLFKLAPTGMREIEVKLDAGDSAVAVIGKNVSVTTDAYPGREWEEKIIWVAPTTNKDGAANALSVRVSLGLNAPPMVLGQQADVKIVSASVDRALEIPSSAIVSKQGKPLVAVIQNDRVHLIPIVTGIESVTSAEVKSGLSAGQKIILPEGKALREGDKIKAVTDWDA